MIEKQLEQWIRLAQNATRESVDEIMKTLDSKASLKTTREIDYALSQVETRGWYGCNKTLFVSRYFNSKKL